MLYCVVILYVIDMDIKIKKAELKDIGVLAEIHSVSLLAAFGEAFPEEIVIEHFGIERRLRGIRRELDLGSPVNFIVYDSEEPIGLLSYGSSRYMEVDDDTIELWRIYFLPGFWGRGAAKVSMNLVLDVINKAGYKKVFLWVLEENIRARRFYEKYGFRDTGRTLEAQLGRPVRDVMYEITLG